MIIVPYIYIQCIMYILYYIGTYIILRHTYFGNLKKSIV